MCCTSMLESNSPFGSDYFIFSIDQYCRFICLVCLDTCQLYLISYCCKYAQSFVITSLDLLALLIQSMFWFAIFRWCSIGHCYWSRYNDDHSTDDIVGTECCECCNGYSTSHVFPVCTWHTSLYLLFHTGLSAYC